MILLLCFKAIPVVLEPGSSLSSMGSGVASTSFLRMMVNGNCLNTAALLAFSNDLATPGLQGDSGLRLASRTKTKLDIVASFLIARKVSFDLVI